MSDRSSIQTTDTPTSATFCWRAHPAAAHIAQAIAGIATVLGTAAMVYLAFQSAGWAILSIVVLFLSLNRFYLPSRFTIDDDSITARYPLRTIRMPWSELRRFVIDGRGGYLSRRATPSRLDAYTGMHILFPPGDEREAVVQRIRAHMHASPAEARSRACTG